MSISKIIKNPEKYIKILLNKLYKTLFTTIAYLLRYTGFYLQKQMDINPKSLWYDQKFNDTFGGFFLPNDSFTRSIKFIDYIDTTRRDMLILLLRSINEREIHGDMAELGVYRGLTAKLIHHYMPDRRLYLFDTFEGFPEDDVIYEEKKTGLKTSSKHFSSTSVESVIDYMAIKNKNVIVCNGRFPESASEDLKDKIFSFVHLDADLYTTTMAGLDFFYKRVSKGGFIVVHDYNAWDGARRAVDEFLHDKKEVPIPYPDGSGSALIVKQ